MILGQERLLFYYPGNHWVESWRNQICFKFSRINKVEIYDKNNFDLIYDTRQLKKFNCLNRFPFLNGLEIEEKEIHVHQSDNINVNQKVSYFNCYEGKYIFSLNSKRQLEVELTKDDYKSEEILHYNLLLDNINLELFKNHDELNEKINNFYTEVKNVTLEIIQREIKDSTINNVIHLISYGRISLQRVYLQSKIRKETEIKLIAVDLNQNKIVWSFDLGQTKRSESDYLIKLNDVDYSRTRTYDSNPFAFEDILIFSHDFNIYALNLYSGMLLWSIEDTFDYPIFFEGKGYMLNVMGEFKVVDLFNGKILFENKNWISEKNIWLQMGYSGNNLQNQSNHIKIYEEYIVMYNFWTGIFYFHDRKTGSFAKEIDIKKQFWEYAIKDKKERRKEIKQKEKDQELSFSTPFWEVYENKLYIQLPHIFCVFDLNDSSESKNTISKLIGEESGIPVDEIKLAKANNKKRVSADDKETRQISLDF